MLATIGCTIGALSGRGGEPVAPSITGSVTPQSYLAGDRIDSDPNYAANISGATFSIDGDTIASIVYQTGVSGVWTTRAASYTVLAGQAVRVLVTATGGPERAFTVDPSVAGAPAQMTAPTLEANGPTQITVTLAAAPDNGGSPITEYDLQYRPTSGGAWTTLQNVTSPVAITGLSASTEYEVQTRAQNAVGNGAWSSSSTETTAAVAPTAPVATGSISDREYITGETEDTVVANVATLFSGTGISYGVSGYAGASLDGNALKIDPATAVDGRTVTLTATNPGGSATIEFAVNVVSVGATLAGGNIEFTAIDASTVQVVVSGGTAFDGTYGFNPALLASGPVNLVAPIISGTTGLGDTLTVDPGLWVFDTDDNTVAPIFSPQWVREPETDIGTDSSTYTIASADQGEDISVDVTCQGVNGSRTASSEATSIPAAPAATFAVTRLYPMTWNGNGTAAATNTWSLPLNPSDYAAGDIIVMPVFVERNFVSGSLGINGARAVSLGAQTGAAQGLRRCMIVSYTLTADDVLIDQPSTTLTITGDGNTNDAICAAYVVEGGVIDGYATPVNGSAGPYSTATVAPSDASNNATIAITSGVDEIADGSGLTWTSPLVNEGGASTSIRGAGAARADNQSGSFTAEVAHTGNDSGAGLVVVTISGAP